MFLLLLNIVVDHSEYKIMQYFRGYSTVHVGSVCQLWLVFCFLSLLMVCYLWQTEVISAIKYIYLLLCCYFRSKHILAQFKDLCEKQTSAEKKRENKETQERKRSVNVQLLWFYTHFNNLYICVLVVFSNFITSLLNTGEGTKARGNQKIKKPQEKRDYGEAGKIKRLIDVQWICCSL